MPNSPKSIFDELGECLDVSSLRVLGRPRPDIFLCGGADPNKSARHLFMQYAKNESEDLYSRLVLAENVVKSWFRADSYNNLLELEEDLASVASIVPIFLESPGSFAEVGSFVSNSNLIKKILVFQDTKYKDVESFINLGPLHKIRSKCSQDDVLCYSWENIADYFSDIKDNMLEKLNVKEKSFSINSIGDLSILTIEILKIAQLAKKNDVKSVLIAAGVDVKDGKMDKIFYILEQMKCVTSEHAGKSRYYKTLCTDTMLRFSFKHDARTRDILEWKYLIANYYSKVDRNWNRLLGFTANGGPVL